MSREEMGEIFNKSKGQPKMQIVDKETPKTPLLRVPDSEDVKGSSGQRSERKGRLTEEWTITIPQINMDDSLVKAYEDSD